MTDRPKVRDVDAAYRNARIARYEAYMATGHTAKAADIARILRDVHGYDVAPPKPATLKTQPAPKQEQERDEEPVGAVVETTAAAPLPEATVEPAPGSVARKQTAPRKPAAKKTTTKPDAQQS